MGFLNRLSWLGLSTKYVHWTKIPLRPNNIYIKYTLNTTKKHKRPLSDNLGHKCPHINVPPLQKTQIMYSQNKNTLLLIK